MIPKLAHSDGQSGGQRLEDHLLGVSVLCERNASKVGLGGAGELLGLLHDLGKYSDQFQDYLRRMSIETDARLRDAERGTVDHATAGAQVIWDAWKKRGKLAGIYAEMLAVCVASHHSGIIDCLAPNGKDKLTARMQKEEAKTHKVEAWEQADARVRERAIALLEDDGLVVRFGKKAEEIALKEEEKSLRPFHVGLLLRFLFSGLIDADRTDTADSADGDSGATRQRGRYVGWRVLIDRTEAELERIGASTPIGEVRRQVAGYCLTAANRPRGVYTLTVPTGGGKTLSSLRFALHHADRWKMDRVIYVSPYISIIDQNAEVVRRVLEAEGEAFGSVVLEHHGNLDPVEQTSRSKLLTENWDAPVVFTTSVQFLESLFGKGTRGVRRMHQLANAVIIFDEAQALPIRCVHLFNNAVNFLAEHCGATVVLCTATQPLLHLVDPRKGRIRLAPEAEIVPDVEQLFDTLRRTEIVDKRKAGGWEYGEVAELAATTVAEAGSCLIVVNTKKEALAVYGECRARMDGIDVYHLSTGMCAAHRMRVLKEIRDGLEAKRRVVCVSTQLIEAGVDISFGGAIRALAGLDSVAQTAGRCNRHAEVASGRVFVLKMAVELPKQLSEMRRGREACERVLDEAKREASDSEKKLCDPKRMADFFHYYFTDRRNEMDYPIGASKAERDDTLLNMLAENRLAWPDGGVPKNYFRQAFQSAATAFEVIDSQTQSVLVPYGEDGREVIAELCASFEPRRNFALLRKAQRFSINVFPHQIAALKNANAVYEAGDGTGILYLNEKYYSLETGLNAAGTEQMEFTIA
ncbi:MAG: CRISPR-associated helicase Cas3' [Bryobacterales bacterium]|nr:CRISPR-associated helicase Cas3' [Bryobacterales bacterium]